MSIESRNQILDESPVGKSAELLINNRIEENSQIGSKIEFRRKDLQQTLVQPDIAAKKSKMERVGDWVCLECNNLNFGFRDICNRCDMNRVDVGKTIMSQHELETIKMNPGNSKE